MNSKTYNLLFYLLLLLLLFFFRFPSIFHHYIDWDEAAMMSEAYAMIRGEILHKDIYHVHPMFQFFIFIPFLFFFNNDLAPHLIKIMNIALIFFGAIMIRKIIFNKIKDIWLANLSSIIFIFYLGFYKWTHSSYGEFYTLFPILISANYIFLNNEITNKQGYLSGLFFGIAFFFKQVAVFDIIPIILTLFFLNLNLFKRKFQILKYIAFGFISATFIAILYPIYCGSLKESINSVFFHNVLSYIDPKSNYTLNLLFIPSFLLKVFFYMSKFYYHVINNIYIFSFIIIAIVLWLINSINCLISKRYSSIKHDNIFIFYTLIWIISIFIGFTIIGRLYTHYFIQLATPFTIFFILLIKNSFTIIKKILFFIISIIILIVSINSFKKEISINKYLPENVKRSQKISNFIKKHTSFDDRIFLYRENSLDIYYLSKRLSNNGIYMYSDMDSAHTHDLKGEKYHRKKFMQNLPLVFIEGNLGSINNSTAPIFFDKIIRKNYKFIKEIDGAKIYFLYIPA